MGEVDTHITNMINSDEANEVQENAVTAKKRGIKAIISFQVNNPYL